MDLGIKDTQFIYSLGKLSEFPHLITKEIIYQINNFGVTNLYIYLGRVSAELEVVKKIITEIGYKPISDSKGITPFLFCSKYGNPDVLEYLINSGCYLINNLTGDTPLHYAVQCNNIPNIEKLLSMGYMFEENKDGLTPYVMAKNEVILEILLKNSIYPTKKDIEYILKNVQNIGYHNLFSKACTTFDNEIISIIDSSPLKMYLYCIYNKSIIGICNTCTHYLKHLSFKCDTTSKYKPIV